MADTVWTVIAILAVALFLIITIWATYKAFAGTPSQAAPPIYGPDQLAPVPLVGG